MQGRQMQRNLCNLGLEANFTEALSNLGYNIHDIYREEPEQGLGMSGQGRLSVCVMEAMTTHNMAAVGYGIRYDFGSFHQQISEEGD